MRAEHLTFLRTAIRTLEQGEVSGAAGIKILKTMSDICLMDAARIELELFERFDSVMDKHGEEV